MNEQRKLTRMLVVSEETTVCVVERDAGRRIRRADCNRMCASVIARRDDDLADRREPGYRKLCLTKFYVKKIAQVHL